jgi:hypothetical protein
VQRVEQIYEQFERFAANTLSLEVGFQQWWEVLVHSWLHSDYELMSHALHNLAAECFLEASELMNMPVDHVVESVIDTFKRKNAAYGNDTLDNFYRVEADFGINPVAGLLTRMSDKMSRIENLRDNEDLEQVGEALQDTFVDLGAYALITMMVMQNTARGQLVEGYKYAEAGVSVDDPPIKTGVVDEYRKHL